VMRDVLVRVVNESYEDELRQVQCPVELVWGEHDTAVPVAAAMQAERLLADSHLTVLSGIGHDVPKEAPAELRAAVDRRLSAAPA
jgi:pimeloyl-ACP methyl ester carboxylesterase